METSYYAQYHTSAEAESIFAQVFGGRLTFCGFEPVAPRKWVQETGRGFKYFFYVNTGNSGFSYLPWGAISLDFVPRRIAGKVKIRPGPKNAAVHYSFKRNPGPDWSIDKNRENFREKVEKIAGESVTEITAWFQRFNSLLDVVAALDQEKAASSPAGFYCYPMMTMAYAFALARVQRVEDARAEFEQTIESMYWDSDLHSELRDLLEAEIQRSIGQ